MSGTVDGDSFFDVQRRGQRDITSKGDFAFWVGNRCTQLLFGRNAVRGLFVFFSGFS